MRSIQKHNLFIHNSNLNNYLLIINLWKKPNNKFQLEVLKKLLFKWRSTIIDDLNTAKKWKEYYPHFIQE
jgi:hypothetical protein